MHFESHRVVNLGSAFFRLRLARRERESYFAHSHQKIFINPQSRLEAKMSHAKPRAKRHNNNVSASVAIRIS